MVFRVVRVCVVYLRRGKEGRRERVDVEVEEREEDQMHQGHSHANEWNKIEELNLLHCKYCIPTATKKELTLPRTKLTP